MATETSLDKPKAKRVKIDRALGDKLAPKLAATFAVYKTVPKVAAKLGISRVSFNRLCDLSASFNKTYTLIRSGSDAPSIGRPVIIDKKLGDDIAPQLAKLFKSGEDVLEVCATLDITERAFYQLLKLSPDFNLAYEHGYVNSAAWWHKLNRKVATGETNGNARSIESIMQNKFGWSRKNENKNEILPTSNIDWSKVSKNSRQELRDARISDESGID